MRKQPDIYTRIVARGRILDMTKPGNDQVIGFKCLVVASVHDEPLRIIACNCGGWDHVSVSLHDRCPNWREMCFVKDIFWHDDEAVMQLHPAKRDYIDCHPFVLHMWKPQDAKIPMPPKIMV